MSRKKSTAFKLARAFLVLVVAAVAFVALVERDKVPGLIEKSSLAAKIYDTRDSLMAAKAEKKKPAKKAAAKKAAAPKKTADKGYSDKDRKKMDKLMSWGSQDY